uniref:PNPLA domain-containing protein n=1 Tax=Romanomermis culicivorax TaxID=13658 RepID=A0A915L0Q6_ROMCU
MLNNKFFSQPIDKFSDFSRLARILTGRAIGVVLGGGGARGAAHVGILKALKDVGVPIDVIGGVSIGSFVGGLFSMDPDVTHLINRAKTWFREMSQFWRKLLDLTYPSSAIFTGAAFNSTLKNQFNDCQIEDLWIPYFNVTTDISSSEMRIHRNG